MKTIHHEIWIDANRTKVFEALTSKDGLDGWWGKALKAEPEIGYVVEFDHGLDETMKMRITDLSANERLAWRCVSDFTDPRSPGSEWLGQEFLFTLRTAEGDPAHEWLGARLQFKGAASDVTILDFRNRSWSSDSRWYPFCNGAWGATLNINLKEYCETGKPTHEH